MFKRLTLIVCFLLTACQAGQMPPSTLKAPAVAVYPVASATSPNIQPTLAPSPSPAQDIMQPYTIAGLREREYAVAAIQITGVLETSSAFTRYAISYPSDGLTITGVMQIPTGAGPFPVIILNHGYYNRDEYLPGDGTSRVAEVFNRSGYLTLASDYRSWGGSDLGSSLFHTGLVVDVLHLLNAIPSIPQADSDQIGMWGHSMGGGITMKALTVDSRIRAAVLYAPNSADDADLISRWGYGCIGNINPGKCNSADLLPQSLSAELIQAYVTAATDPETLRKIAPIYHLDTITAPIQIHIGEEDGDYIGSTPPEWSYKLNDALLAAGKPVELFRYPGQRHSFTGESREIFLQRILAFFDQYLKP